MNNKIYDVVVATIKANRSATIKLIVQNGIPLSANASDEEIFNAFTSLARTSKSFVNSFAKLVERTQKQVVAKNSLSLNANGQPNFGQELSTSNTQSGGMWDYLGKVFTPEVTSNLINNIFSAFGNRGGEQGLNEANTRYDSYQGGGYPQEEKGLSVGAIIGISLGAIALLGMTIYIATRKK